jgi:arylsulfatase A-like enzyme
LPNGSLPPAPNAAACPPLPANFAVPQHEPPLIHQYRSSRGEKLNKWTDTKWRQYLWVYNRLIEKADALVGGILTALRDHGYENNTVIIFSSDHGDGLAAHHLIQKGFLYEEMIRVPLLISYPGHTLRAKTNTRLVSAGLDLFRTICDYAEVPPPASIEGRSLRALAEGRSVSSWRSNVVTETPVLNDLGAEGRMIQDARYKYMVYSAGGQPREQLIDLSIDPGEMHNLIEDVNYSAVLSAKRSALQQWCQDTDDHFVVPDE